jgi:type IV pilus assembly protein PilM
MEVQVESEANQYIPFALEEVNLDFQVIGPAPSSPDDVEVLLAASRKEKVEDRVAAAEVAELKPVVMDVESYAVQAAYELVTKQLPGEGAGQVIALIDVGAAAMKVTILKDNQQLYTREQAFGGGMLTEEIMRAYGMGPEEAENLKRSGTPPDNYETEILHPFIENMAQEVARALQFFFTSTPHNEVHHIILAGGSALDPRRCRDRWPAHQCEYHPRRSVCRHGNIPAYPRQATRHRCPVADGCLRPRLEEV